MNPDTRLQRAGIILAAGMLLVAGCTASASEDPPSTPMATISGTAAAIDPSSLRPSTAAPPSPLPSDPGTPVVTTASSDISPQEAADRAAIEAQWIKFWDVYQGIVRTSPDDRQALAQDVAIPALADKMVAAAEKASLQKKDNYGEVVHHTFWQFEVAGKPNAVIADCLDQSKAGTVDTSTGTILTVGPERANMRGQMTRGGDGVWRVETITSLNSTNC